MSNYVGTKKDLDRIRNKYGCKGEVLFRTAIQYVVDCGRQCFEDEEWVKQQLNIVDEKHNAFEHDNKTPFIGRDFEKAIIECAVEIAKVNTYHLLIYIQKEVFLSNEGGIDYQRAVELLKKCMYDIEEYVNCENKLTYQEFEFLGFTDDEMEQLEFGYLLNEEEE